MSATTSITLHTTIDSPIGPLLLLADDEGGAAGGPGGGDRAGPLRGLYMQAGPRPKRIDPRWRAASGAFDEVRAQLDAYFAGTREAFDLPLAPAGTSFQLAVWAQLRAIPFGETRTYGELAVRLGQPTAARAVGLANGDNPIAVIVPCHRVIGADGSLTGFGGGLERKRILLDLEAGRQTLGL